MSSELVRSTTDNGVTQLVLNRPEKLNAINSAMVVQFLDALSDAERSNDTAVVIITGSGKAFTTGHDLEAIDEKPGPDVLYEAVRSANKPTIAAINGACIAAGAGIALSCDIRLASTEAVIGWPHAKRGIMSVSGPALLANTIPLNIAMEYMFTGELVGSEEAGRWGMVNRVLPSAELMPEAVGLAQRIAACAPLSVRAMKKAASRARNATLADAEAFCHELLPAVMNSRDAREGLAAFVERREPVWSGS